MLFVQPMCFGLVGMSAYAVWVLVRAQSAQHTQMNTKEDIPFDWQSLLTLTAVVCGVSHASAALNAHYGQSGLCLGAALSGLVDAHAIVPTVASLWGQNQRLPQEALMPLLIALSTNTLTKSVIALQSGGWAYAKKYQLVCG